MRPTSPSRRRFDFFPYALVLPLVAITCFVFLYPILSAVVLSFRNNYGEFVGIRNYVRLLNDSSFWFNVKLTLIYVALYSGGVFFVGFVTALVSNMDWRGQKVCNTMMTLPYAIPDVAASLIWMWMFDYQYGVLNSILMRLGVISQPIGWLISPSAAMHGVLMATVWRLFPLHSMIILAALRSVPKELYEAADIDGANSLQSFFYITVPSIKRVLEVLVLLTIVWSFQRFTILYLLTGGGPAGTTETAVVRIYRTAFEYFDQSYAYTMGTFVLMVLIVITLVYLWLNKPRESEGEIA